MSMFGNSTANINAEMRVWATASLPPVAAGPGSLTMSDASTVNHSGNAYVIFGQGFGPNTGCTGYLTISLTTPKFFGNTPETVSSPAWARRRRRHDAVMTGNTVI